MDKKPVTADVVVACLVAGVGAWATEVTVAPAYTYASELFGPGHDTLEYPGNTAPVVTLTIPGNADDDSGTSEVNEATTDGDDHNGEAVIIFMLTGGVFDTNIDRLMWDADGPEMQGTGGGDSADVLCSTTVATGAPAASADTADVGCGLPVPAPGTVASIMSGGEKGEHSITIKIEAGQGDVDTDPEAGKRNAGVTQMITFELPELNGLEGLGGATAGKPKMVKLMATSRIVSGAFTDGPLITKTVAGQKVPDGRDVVTAVNAVSVAIKGVDKHDIAIDDSKDGSMKAFQHVLGAKKGFVKLADVMIETLQKHEISKEVKGTDAKPMYSIREGASAAATAASANTDIIYTLPTTGKGANAPTIHDLDGKPIDAGLRGTLTITAEGSRDLFNDGDMMFIDYDGDGMAGDSEEIDTDGKLAEGTALSIDPDDSDSFDGGTGTFSVYYMASGKDHINHGSTITVTASVDYSDPSARDETDVMSMTTLNFDGVGNPVMAYAIPHSTNEMGDKGNVRVRCEDSTDCRVFLECWGDDGTETRGFGEVLGGVPADGVKVWNGAAIESVTGRMPDSRHSCRVLSKGDVTVQQLTRDGHSNTLVNNTYVAD